MWYFHPSSNNAFQVGFFAVYRARLSEHFTYIMSRAARLQVISTARTCNLILIVLDCLKPISHKKLIEHELEGFGIRLNKQPPQLTFRKKDKGGITFTSAVQTGKLDHDGVLPSLKPSSFPWCLNEAFISPSFWGMGLSLTPSPFHWAMAIRCH